MSRKRLADTILYAVVIYCIGCIIPTPLDQQQSAPDRSPELRTDKADPPFGPLSHAQSDLFELRVAVDDPDVDDVLHARLYFRNPTTGTLFYPGLEEATGVPDATDPTLRFVTFQAQTLCFGRSGVLFLYVVVADRPFSLTDPSKVVAGGLTDSNYWVLTCM